MVRPGIACRRESTEISSQLGSATLQEQLAASRQAYQQQLQLHEAALDELEAVRCQAQQLAASNQILKVPSSDARLALLPHNHGRQDAALPRACQAHSLSGLAPATAVIFLNHAALKPGECDPAFAIT